MQTPVLGEQVARHNHPFLQRLSLRFLSRRGWRISGTLPNLPKMILLGAPHTSNWDFIYSMAFMYATGFSASWIGKESLFKWPFSGLMRRLGKIHPRHRSGRHTQQGGPLEARVLPHRQSGECPHGGDRFRFRCPHVPDQRTIHAHRRHGSGYPRHSGVLCGRGGKAPTVDRNNLCRGAFRFSSFRSGSASGRGS